MVGTGKTGRMAQVVAVGVSLMVLAWIGHAGIDAAFEEESFLHNITHPEPREAWIRTVFVGTQLLFLVYITTLLRRRRRLELSLTAATERAEIERNKCETILEALGDGISIQDKELRVLYQNRSHREMMGDHAGEFCYRAYQNREEACPGCHLLQSFQDGRVHVRESAVDTPAGRQHAEIISSPLRDQHGRIVAGIEAVRDITERKAAEERLRHQTAAMESSIDGIAILDAEARYTYLNPAHVRIYGYRSTLDLLGRSWQTLYREDEIARFEADIIPRLYEEGRWRGEAVGLRRDGSTFPQELSLTVLEDGGIVCVVRDISRRRQAEQTIRLANLDLQRRTTELEAANGELEAFGYSLSHDLRNYLTRISAAAQLMEELEKDCLGDNGRTCLETIVTASEAMEELIQAMLFLGRVGRQELVRGPVDLSTMARKVAAELRLGAPERPVFFHIEDGLVAEGDAKLLQVVLQNLLGNAWKFTRRTPGAHIEFGLADQDGEEVFCVRDNGPGFDMSEADRLFKPFQRLSNTEEVQGTGVGLATVARIIHRHGGRIWAEAAPGRGARFFFTLGKTADGSVTLPSAPA